MTEVTKFNASVVGELTFDLQFKQHRLTSRLLEFMFLVLSLLATEYTIRHYSIRSQDVTANEIIQ